MTPATRRRAVSLAGAALLVAALASSASAAPQGAQVLFARSCGDCAQDAFCEFAYPGTPEGHVACVGAPADLHSLYRRYEEPAFTLCGTNQYCCTPRWDGHQTADLDACKALCEADSNCQHFSFDSTRARNCFTNAGVCTTWDSFIGFSHYAKKGNPCPTTQCT
ncbi:hypothetical protein DFJ74DRAFT_702985 [Hyaloraphidium curvatum]|nr:hypothetical protein DFJ74DRAFT_702985 [Hyaloraphidium curvatum]